MDAKKLGRRSPRSAHLATAEAGPRACRMLRFGFVLLITALPLLGMEAMSTRRETTKQVFDSAAEALNACQSWRLREGQFSALIPAAAPVSTQARPVQTDIRSCEADLDHALVPGAPLQRCARRATTTKRCGRCRRPIRRTFPYLLPDGHNWRIKPLACLEQLPRHQRQSLLESPARRCEFGGEHRPGGPDPAPLSADPRIHSESRVVSNWRCQVARRSGDVSPPSNQTPVRARDTAT